MQRLSWDCWHKNALSERQIQDLLDIRRRYTGPGYVRVPAGVKEEMNTEIILPNGKDAEL